MGASKVLDPKRIAMAFGLSALRFIVAVCFLSGVSACIRLFGSLSLMLPAPFAIASKRLSVRPGSSKTEPSLRECEVKSVVLVEERSECCETETESAFVVQSDGRRKASKARKMDALSTLGPFAQLAEFTRASARPARVAPKGRQSTFQVELVAQPIGNGLDHLATIRILLRPVPHDRDFP